MLGLQSCMEISRYVYGSMVGDMFEVCDLNFC
jgi:hypothetical protein